MCVLNREVERSAVTLEAFAHQHRLDQDKIENLSSKVRQLERTIDMRDLKLSETEQLVRELQFCTFDGIFVWKISDFSRRRQDAVASRTPAMFSPGVIKDLINTHHPFQRPLVSAERFFLNLNRLRSCGLCDDGLACRRGKFHFPVVEGVNMLLPRVTHDLCS